MGFPEDLKRVMTLPLLMSMPREAKERIARVFLEVSEKMALADGEALLEQGYISFETGFVLLDGAVHVEKEGAEPFVVTAPALLGEMSQFNPRVQRTATVRVKDTAEVLRFSWEDMYKKAQEILTQEEQGLLVDGIERIILERFDRETLTDLPLFVGLSDHLKLRASLILLWVTKRITLAAGEVLFKQHASTGGMGYLLIRGAIRLEADGKDPRILSAPHILGVTPKPENLLTWSATAIAQEDAEILRFPWPAYTTLLRQTFDYEALHQISQAIQSCALTGFWH